MPKLSQSKRVYETQQRNGVGGGAGAIRDVWAPNLEQEMRNIREAIETHPFVALVGRDYPQFMNLKPAHRILNFLEL